MFNLILIFVQKYINHNLYGMDISVDDVKSTDMLPLSFPEVNDYLVSLDDDVLPFCEDLLNNDDNDAATGEDNCLGEDSLERVLLRQLPMTRWQAEGRKPALPKTTVTLKPIRPSSGDWIELYLHEGKGMGAKIGMSQEEGVPIQVSWHIDNEYMGLDNFEFLSLKEMTKYDTWVTIDETHAYSQIAYHETLNVDLISYCDPRIPVDVLDKQKKLLELTIDDFNEVLAKGRLLSEVNAGMGLIVAFIKLSQASMISWPKIIMEEVGNLGLWASD